ncbi:hypothetical protein [Pseudomonas sp. JAI120]|uniref:hypothetical protein n=1 Tax=Pseudomonas sp. JAI120 TaxID=2723063 RepID=UPI0030DCFECA
MSFSIDSSPFVKFDATPNDSQVPVLSKTGGSPGTATNDSKVIPPTIQQDLSRGSQGEMMISAGALSKLFDMLEQVFRAMREMVTGKTITPDLKTNSDTSAKVNSGTDPQKKNSTDSSPLPKVAPNAADQAKVQPDASPLPKVVPNAADQPKVQPDASLLPKVVPNAADQPKVQPDANPLPKVAPNAADQPKVQPGVNPLPKTAPNGDDQMKVKIKTDDGVFQVIPPKPTPRYLPPVPQPGIHVTNDANAQVKVEVNVGHCHCPDTRAEHDKGRQTTVIPQPKADATPQTTVTPQLKPDATPQTTVTPQPKPDATPQTTVKPQPKLEDTPQPPVNPVVPKPAPDVTSPGPAESHADIKGWSFINRRRART